MRRFSGRAGRAWGGVGGLALMCLAGCAFQTTRTARQLETGDVVLSGSLDEVGTLFLPRANVQAMYGLGGKGDMSLHLGTSGLLHNAGLGARYYLGSDWTLGTQANLLLFQDINLYSSRELSIFYNGSFRLSTAATRTKALYGGVQIDLYALQPDSFDNPLQDVFFNGGAVVGFDVLDSGGFGWQLEAKFTPFFFNSDDGFGMYPFLDNDFESNFLFSAQFGFSIYKRLKTRELAIAPSESVWLNDMEKEIEQYRANPDAMHKAQPAKRPSPGQEERATPSSSPGSAPIPPKPE